MHHYIWKQLHVVCNVESRLASLDLSTRCKVNYFYNGQHSSNHPRWIPQKQKKYNQNNGTIQIQITHFPWVFIHLVSICTTFHNLSYCFASVPLFHCFLILILILLHSDQRFEVLFFIFNYSWQVSLADDTDSRKRWQRILFLAGQFETQNNWSHKSLMTLTIYLIG